LRLRPGGGKEELNTTTNLVMGAVGLEGLVVDGGQEKSQFPHPIISLPSSTPLIQNSG